MTWREEAEGDRSFAIGRIDSQKLKMERLTIDNEVQAEKRDELRKEAQRSADIMGEAS